MSGHCSRFPKPRKLAAICAALAIAASVWATPREAKATGIFGLPYPSLTTKTICAALSYVTNDPRCLTNGYKAIPPPPPYWKFVGKIIWLAWDPPSDDISSISFSFYFNPELFTPVVDSAGFLCGFTASGNCPDYLPGVGIEPIGLTATPPIPGPATGTQTITIGADSVTIDATFSPAVIGEGLFFAMEFDTTFPADSVLIDYSTGMLPGADYYVTSYSCTTLDFANNCGSGDYTASFKVMNIPELSTWMMTLIGFAGLGFAAGRLRKAPQPAL